MKLDIRFNDFDCGSFDELGILRLGCALDEEVFSFRVLFELIKNELGGGQCLLAEVVNTGLDDVLEDREFVRVA